MGGGWGARCRTTLQTLNNNFLSDIPLTAIILLYYIFHVFFYVVCLLWSENSLVGGMWIEYKDDIQHQRFRQLNISQLQLFNLHLGEPIIFRGAHRTHKLWKIIVIPFTTASLYKAVSWHIFHTFFLLNLFLCKMHNFST